MNFLAKFFIKNDKFTLVMTLFLLIFGISGVLSLNSESFPSVNIGAVVITTRYDGATAEDIETKITKPIEDEIKKVSGLKVVKSTSQSGLSTIMTEADIDKYPTEKVISDLQRAVDRTVGLPPDLLFKPVFSEIKSDEFPVIEIAIVGDGPDRLRDRAADELAETIKENKKVSSTLLQGFNERRFNIYLDQSKLLADHVSIPEVQSALMSRNLTIPAGELKDDTSQKLVRIEGKAKSISDLQELIIRSNFNGQMIKLKDVARIEDSSEEPRVIANYGGKPATFIVITKKGGADIIKLADEIKSSLDDFREKYKNQLEFHIFSNEGIRVGDRLSVLTTNGWQGIILVIFFLLLFMRGKVGIMTSISLPLTLAATMGAIAALGYTLNTITIIALVISIGMLVDNAVVISENFARLRDEGLSVDEALHRTINDLWAPITATVLTTVTAFLPMLVTTGVMGQFIKAIPIVVSLSLMLSLAESFFFLPARLKWINYQPTNTKEKKLDFIDRVVAPRFERQMIWLVDNKWKSALIFTSIFWGTIFLLAFGNRINLFPSDQTEIYVIRLEANKGTRVEKTNQFTSGLVAEIEQKFKNEILHVVGSAGSSSTDASDPKGERGSNVAMIRVYVNKQTQDRIPTKVMLERLRSVKSENFNRMTVEALVNGPPVGDPVNVTFRSNNAEQLDQVAQHIKMFVSQQKGIFDAKIDDVYGDDEVTVDVNYARASQVGLSLQDIGLNVRAAIAGITVGDVNLDNREVDYFIRFEEQDKKNINNLANIKIPDRAGNLIPLKTVAQFKVQSGAPQIKRYDFKRAKTVTSNLDDTVMTSIQANQLIADEFKKIESKYKDVQIVFGGEAEKTNESVASLFSALILSLIGIFALLVLIFGSFLSPLIILTTIPLGLTGVSIAFFIHQKDISFMALIGVIGLGGIIVNSGIILISFIEQMKQETAMSLREILIKASSLRLRAVLVTSLTTISGLIPTAYGIGGVDYFIIPMALALAWGLSTGTVFTLYWVPPAYAIVEDIKLKWNRWMTK
jgi:multidrug efflux pump subunit AcrB